MGPCQAGILNSSECLSLAILRGNITLSCRNRIRETDRRSAAGLWLTLENRLCVRLSPVVSGQGGQCGPEIAGIFFMLVPSILSKRDPVRAATDQSQTPELPNQSSNFPFNITASLELEAARQLEGRHRSSAHTNPQSFSIT